MGKKKKKQQGKTTPEVRETSKKKQQEIMAATEGSSDKDNADQVNANFGEEVSLELYAQWPQLEEFLIPHLSFRSEEQPDSDGAQPPPGKEAADVSILLPRCGNLKLWQNLYDFGFKNITILDFWKDFVSHTSKRKIRVPPEMELYGINITELNMPFAMGTFDAIVDQGGLDSLMPGSGCQFLFEVKRVLKAGGKYVCLTLAELQVLELLFHMFRFGWKMSLYAISQEASSRDPELYTLMVVAENDSSSVIYQISSFLEQDLFESNQVHCVSEALLSENSKRLEYDDGDDVIYSLQDLLFGATGKLSQLVPGRRVNLSLERSEGSVYNGVLLDAKEDSGPSTYPYAVYLVPQNRAHECKYTSEEGQWIIVKSSKASRLLMILLDSSNSDNSMDLIQMDLSPLVKELEPEDCGEGYQIPYLSEIDEINKKQIVYEDSSVTTGPVVVEDVIYQDIIDDGDDYKGCTIRHLIFKRTKKLVHSRALLSIKESNSISTDVGIEKEQQASKSDSQSSMSPVSGGEVKVVHNHLVSRYHRGIVFGIELIPSFLKVSTSARGLVNTVVIGLGGGLLPMFMKNYLPTLKIEVVELDSKVLQVARDYFGFSKDESLKVHIADGIKFVKEKADGNNSCKIDILVVDVDSPDTSSTLSCPAADFVDESFLWTVIDSLSERGLFIINLGTGSSAERNAVISRLKKIFSCILSIPIQEDSEVLFALKTTVSPIDEDQLSEACEEFVNSLKHEKKRVEKERGLTKSIELLN